MQVQLLERTLEARKIARLHQQLALATARPPAVVKEEPCIGHKVAALQTAIRDLMSEHDDDLMPEARTILRDMASLSFRCRDLWRAS